MNTTQILWCYLDQPRPSAMQLVPFTGGIKAIYLACIKANTDLKNDRRHLLGLRRVLIRQTVKRHHQSCLT